MKRCVRAFVAPPLLSGMSLPCAFAEPHVGMEVPPGPLKGRWGNTWAWVGLLLPCWDLQPLCREKKQKEGGCRGGWLIPSRVSRSVWGCRCLGYRPLPSSNPAGCPNSSWLCLSQLALL